MNVDSYNEVIFGKDTCKEIARVLREGKNKLFNTKKTL